LQDDYRSSVAEDDAFYPEEAGDDFRDGIENLA